MKRIDQSRLMKKKIKESAIKEFNAHDYETASINRICADAEISKGIVYHYFKNKDELYLSCLKECYDTLLNYYYEVGIVESSNIELGEYMKVRLNFFKSYPQFQGLFFYAMLLPLDALKQEVDSLRKEVDDMNVAICKKVLARITLRDHITVDKAISYMEILQSALNEYFRKEAESGTDFEKIVNMHEQMISEWIDIMLFGLVKDGKK